MGQGRWMMDEGRRKMVEGERKGLRLMEERFRLRSSSYNPTSRFWLEAKELEIVRKKLIEFIGLH